MVAQLETGFVAIPDYTRTFDGFCEWIESPCFPERGRFSFIRDEVWMDLEPELLFLHNKLKLRVAAALDLLATKEKLGYTFTDGAFLKNKTVRLATEPDAMFVSYEAIEEGRAELVEARNEGDMIVEGSPDAVIEVVSDSSVAKDTIKLRDLYWQAGIPEYWLVDARSEPIKFDILKHGPKGYIATRKTGGWLKSGIFNRLFRITQETDRLGKPQFALEIKMIG